MADVARCICPHDSQQQKCGLNRLCPIHGDSAKDPIRPYALTWTDRKLLKAMRIGLEDSAEIQDVRQADEDRFRRD